MTTLNYRSGSEVWKDAAKFLKNPPKGIPCPSWPMFNDFLGGLRANEVTLLCAPTGAGKTQLLANISVQLLAQSVPHFVAPVETGDVDFLARVASVMSKEDLNTGDAVAPFKVDAVGDALADSGLIDNLYLATYDNRVAIQDMVNMLVFMVKEHQIKVALLDNLNFFLNVVSAQQEKAEMDNAMHEFVMLVKKLPIHIILIVHPRKTEGGRVESEFDIKGSATAVQEAANVCLFNRPKQSQIDDGEAMPTYRELVFRKIRKRGLHVGKPIMFRFHGGRYEELEARHDLKPSIRPRK